MYISVIFKTRGEFVPTAKPYEFKLEARMEAPDIGEVIKMATKGPNPWNGYIDVCHGAKVMVIEVYDAPRWPEHTKEVVWDRA